MGSSTTTSIADVGGAAGESSCGCAGGALAAMLPTSGFLASSFVGTASVACATATSGPKRSYASRQSRLVAGFAPALLVLLPHDWKGVEDVGKVVAVEAVEVCIDAIEVGAQLRSPILVPDKRRSVVAAVARERGQVMCGVDEFEDARYQ